MDVSVLEKKQYKGKTLLLCSDGLSGYFDAPALAQFCRTYTDCETMARAMVDGANAAGGSDNITAIVAKLK